LEDSDGCEQELLQKVDEMKEQQTQPVRTVGGLGRMQWSPEGISGSVRSRPNLSHTSYDTPSREQQKDEMRVHSSASSGSHLRTVSGIGYYEYDDNNRGKPVMANRFIGR